jgi:hypothetical protein
MKLKYSFEMVDMGEEIVAVPVGNGANQIHGILKLNKEGKEIFDMIVDGMTEETIIDSLALKYDNKREMLAESVQKFITKLNEAGVLTE